MKLFLTALATLIIGSSFAQDCERIVDNCEELLVKNTDGREFISDGQVYTAFLDRGEVAKFETTLFGGSTYRIAASAGDDEDYVIFTIKDPAGNILFSNSNYKNAPYWDFEVDESITITIETKLDPDLKFSGCLVMLIGFQ
mmetsp:Transcript_22918/g.30525  ORF Transcript_22918/g.30525 Transcript_22918/m.30525 type:complete len:141 (-) Transcript_22918:434-856(-)